MFLDARCDLGTMLRKLMRQPRGDNAKKTKGAARPSFKAERGPAPVAPASRAA
jgi:hypothetical protein